LNRHGLPDKSIEAETDNCHPKRERETITKAFYLYHPLVPLAAEGANQRHSDTRKYRTRYKTYSWDSGTMYQRMWEQKQAECTYHGPQERVTDTSQERVTEGRPIKDFFNATQGQRAEKLYCEVKDSFEKHLHDNFKYEFEHCLRSLLRCEREQSYEASRLCLISQIT